MVTLNSTTIGQELESCEVLDVDEEEESIEVLLRFSNTTDLSSLSEDSVIIAGMLFFVSLIGFANVLRAKKLQMNNRQRIFGAKLVRKCSVSHFAGRRH